MTDYAKFGHGGVTYPIAAATTNTFLKDADPAIYYTIDFFQSVLNTYLTARLTAELSRSPAITALTAAVASVVPLDPLPYLQEQNFKFPLLAVHRSKETFTRMSLSTMGDDSEWAVDYILPPLTGAQMERLSPLLRAVGQVLSNRIENVSDPAYAGGANIWTLAGIAKVELTEASYGAFAGTGNQVFPAWRGKLVVKEIDTPAVVEADMENLAGIDSDLFVEGVLPADSTTEVRVLQTVGAGVAVSPLSAVVIHGTSTTFTAVGGSGASVVFFLISNNSGGSIDASTGVYTAGSTPNVYDVVGVRDSYSTATPNAVIQVV